MVNVLIDNNTVSIVLGHGEQTSVPSGETWLVSIHMSAMWQFDPSFENCAVQINGTNLMSSVAGDNLGDANRRMQDHVFTGGDTIRFEAQNNRANSGTHISGFIVN